MIPISPPPPPSVTGIPAGNAARSPAPIVLDLRRVQTGASLRNRMPGTYPATGVSGTRQDGGLRM